MKEHRILKYFMPLLACVYGFAGIYACGVIGGGEFSLPLFCARVAAQIAFIVLTVWLIRKPLTHLFPQMGRYPIRLPAWHVAVMLLLVTPLWCILKGKLMYLLLPGTELQPMTYALDELKTDLVLSLSAIFVGPVCEELCFRFLPLTAYKRKASQIIVGVLAALFFGLLHTKNLLGSFVDALIFTLVFIFTKQIGTSMVLHGCINLWPTVFCVLVHLGLMDIQNSSMPVIWLIGDGTTLFAAVFMAAAGVAVHLIGRNKVKKNKEASTC